MRPDRFSQLKNRDFIGAQMSFVNGDYKSLVEELIVEAEYLD